MSSQYWYAHLKKPSWAPPAWLFGPVWTVLYVLIAISFGSVFYKIYSGLIPMSVAWPLALNLIFNFSFTPIQFGLKNNYLAAIDILLVLATLVWGVVVINHSIQWAAWLLVPYLLWVSFATVLQLTMTYLNRGV